MPSMMLQVAALAVAADQVTKTLAHTGQLGGPWVDAVDNPEFALGLAGGSGPLELLVGVGAFGVLCLWLHRGAYPAMSGSVGVGLVVGGTVGNLVDRAAMGAVRDMLVGPGIVYNLADVALVMGMVLLLIGHGVTALVSQRRAPA